MINMPQCDGADFCEEIAGATDTSFSRFYEGNPPHRRARSTANFEVLADMSPLVTGHLLLLPRKHYLSFAQVLGHHPGETEELLDDIAAIYRETFGEPLILEHGSGIDEESHACITHAHLHLLPADADAVDDLLVQDGLSYVDLESITELREAPWPESAYFLRHHRGRSRVYVPNGNQKRQYLRSIVATTLDIPDPEWDYAVIVRKDCLRRTMKLVESWSR
ncbi:hypothetical protein ACFOWZ_47115 [Lentzea rhizosphaerae]|uniref:HIT domain-containing protein n=1 Tax=Lentzea rhizosphaerae TaxID=2041025 RepID=A0ABV8CB35_9PSEU